MNESSIVELWATAASTNSTTGRQIFWRYAKNLRSGFERSAQPTRIIIVWEYASESGQPGTIEYDRMNRLEDALDGVLKGSELATLALVSTGENLREWTYYARSEHEFAARFNDAIAELPPFPIEIHTAHDPTWSMYAKFRSDNPST